MIYWICYILVFLPILIFFPTKLIGRKNLIKNQPAIYVCNHQSNWDCVTIAHKHGKKIFLLSKNELYKNKFNGWFLKQIGGIPIDRNNVGIEGIKKCLTVLKQKRQLLIFPSGTRKSTSAEVDNLKNGMALLALKSGAPIVPMVLDKKTKFLRRNTLIVGEPIYMDEFIKDGLTKENFTKISNIVTDKMKELLKTIN